MSFTVITNPTVGETLKVDTFGIPVIDNLNFLNDSLTAGQDKILNGSFETGTGANTAPPSWDLVITSGNSTDFETSAANTRHGKQAFSMTTPGAISGGVTLTSTDFITVAEDLGFVLRWQMKATIATTKITINAKFFDEGESLLSTEVFYTSSTTNPTVWTAFQASVTPPAGAKLAKIEIVGVDNTTAATNFFDGLQLVQNRNYVPGITVLTSSGSLVVPAGIFRLGFHIIGGGAGGATGGSIGGGGGGGGGGLTGIREVIPGETVTVTIGTGGAGGAPGTAGTVTTISAPSFASVSGDGGGGAVSGGGGAGGSASGTIASTDNKISGHNGGTQSETIASTFAGGHGGNGGGGGLGGLGGKTSGGNSGTSGTVAGGGGGGGGNGNTAGSGAAGVARFFF